MRRIVTTAVLAALAAAPALAEQTLEGVADATYQLDPNHSFLTFNVTHNGISTYTVYFTDFDATLDFNPEDPTASTLNVTINPAALEANYPADYKAGHPDSEFESWNDALSNDDRFLQADEYGEITFLDQRRNDRRLYRYGHRGPVLPGRNPPHHAGRDL